MALLPAAHLYLLLEKRSLQKLAFAKANFRFEHVSLRTKLIIRFIAMMMILLTVGMQLKFVFIPTLDAYKFWLAIGAAVLSLIVGHA